MYAVALIRKRPRSAARCGTTRYTARMPVYEFICKRCEHAFEELVLGSESVACPKCRGTQAEKQFSVFGTGSTSASAAESFAAGPGDGGCGTCGDPRGPGACSMN